MNESHLERSNHFPGKTQPAPGNSTERDSKELYPDLLLALSLTKFTENQGVRERVDVVQTELSPNTVNRRKREKEGGYEGQADTIRLKYHSSLIIRHFNKFMYNCADFHFPMLFFHNLMISNTFGRTSTLRHFDLAIGNSTPKTNQFS